MSRFTEPLTRSDAVIFGSCVVLVLLALYLLKERRQRVRVPNIRLLESALNAAIATRMGSVWRRLRSFLLQILCAGIAVLVLTDPSIEALLGPEKGADAPQGRDQLVLVLDRSRSMSALALDSVRCPPAPTEPGSIWSGPEGCFVGRGVPKPSVFDVARAEAHRAIVESPEGTRILLVTLDREVTTHLVWGGPKEALQILYRLRPVDLADDVSALAGWLEAGQPMYGQSKIVVISDLQSKKWGALGATDPVELIGVGRDAGNLVIEEFRVRARLSAPGTARVLCRLRFLMPKAQREMQAEQDRAVQLEISARTTAKGARYEVVEVRSLSLNPGESTVLEFDVSDLPGPVLRARVWPIVKGAESRDQLDANLADSVRFAHSPALKQVQVGLVGQAPVSLVAALIADPFINVLEPLGAPDIERADVIVSTNESPTDIKKPTLILNPPVGEGRWDARGTLEQPELRVRKHRFWTELHPGSLRLESVVWFESTRRADVILDAKKKAVGVLSLDGVTPVIQLGLDPNDSAWVSDLTYPAVLARCVDLLHDRVEEIGREERVGFVSLLDWSRFPRLELRGLDAKKQHKDELGTTVWVPTSGVYLLSSDDSPLRPLVVGFVADDAEDIIEQRSAGTLRRPWADRTTSSRSGLWRTMLLLLLGLLLVDRWLFVSRRVV